METFGEFFASLFKMSPRSISPHSNAQRRRRRRQLQSDGIRVIGQRSGKLTPLGINVLMSARLHYCVAWLCPGGC